jgi:hypothetical protein
MPELDHNAASAPLRGATGDVPSRRTVLRLTAGVGAVGIGGAVLGRVTAPARIPSQADDAAGAPNTALGRAEPGKADAAPADTIVIQVRDAATGELNVFRGESEVRITDRDLTARIIRASR